MLALTLFVAGEYPNLHLGQNEVGNGLRDSILQFVLHGAGANQRQVFLYFVVHSRQSTLSVTDCTAEITTQITNGYTFSLCLAA